MTARLLRAAAVALVAGLALLLGAAPALAHTRLQSSDPPDGASLDTAPQHVALTFNEEMSAEFSTITVVGPDGAHYETGDVGAEGGTISTALLPLGPAGQYKIGYRVVSADEFDTVEARGCRVDDVSGALEHRRHEEADVEVVLYHHRGVQCGHGGAFVGPIRASGLGGF